MLLLADAGESFPFGNHSFLGSRLIDQGKGREIRSLDDNLGRLGLLGDRRCRSSLPSERRSACS
jgi:hypothetical protein